MGAERDGISTGRRDHAFRFTVASFGLALFAALILLLAPFGESVEAVRVGERVSAPRVSHHSLLEREGWSVAIPLAVPVGIAGAAFLVGRGRWRRRVRIGSAILLAAFVVVAIFSIGIYYLPAAGTIVAAAASASPPEDIE